MIRRYELTDLLGTQRNGMNSPASKLNAFINYLADNYSANENGGISLEEAIYIARKEIGESVVTKRETEGIAEQDGNLLSNDNTYGSKGNWTVGFFLRYPRDAVQYLLVQAKQQSLKNGDAARAARFNAVAESINSKRHAYDTYSFFQGNRANDMVNIEKRYIGENGVDDAFNRNKAGFFDRIFRRTSRQYKDFEKEFKNYRQGSKIEDGLNSRDANRESVERTAKAYLRHKIPGWKGEGLPTLEQINALRGKSRDRAMLCYNTLCATKESAETEQKIRNLSDVVENSMTQDGTNIAVNKLYEANSIDATNIQNILRDGSPIERIVGIDGQKVTQELTEKQKLFQKDLAKDLEDKTIGVDVQKLYDNINEIEVKHDDLDMSMGD